MASLVHFTTRLIGISAQLTSRCLSFNEVCHSFLLPTANKKQQQKQNALSPFFYSISVFLQNSQFICTLAGIYNALIFEILEKRRLFQVPLKICTNKSLKKFSVAGSSGLSQQKAVCCSSAVEDICSSSFKFTLILQNG